MSVVPVLLGESCTRPRRRPRNVKEQLFLNSPFGDCIAVLAARAREKPADWLAGRIACTVRHANHLISGRSRPSPDALLALLVAVK